MLDVYELTKKIIAYVKDERFNLNIFILTLKSVVNCDVLVWKKVFKELVLVMHLLKHANMQQ